MRIDSGACGANKSRVFEMLGRGCSLTSIGREIGTTRRMVKNFLRRNGVDQKFPTALKKDRHYNWKGGRLIDKDGYVNIYCPDHPNRRKHTPYILEHRLVMENHIGRYLHPREVVHHKNKDKADNRIENLELFSCNSLHLKSELSGHIPNWTPDGKARMQAAVNRTGDFRRGKSPRLWSKQGGPLSK